MPNIGHPPYPRYFPLYEFKYDFMREIYLSFFFFVIHKKYSEQFFFSEAEFYVCTNGLQFFNFLVSEQKKKFSRILILHKWFALFLIFWCHN